MCNSDQSKASQLAGEAFELWQAGRHEQAHLLYEKAISLADPGHYGLASYYGEHACVLNQLGRHEQATTQLENALAAEVRQRQAEGSPAMTIARYFLADQLLRHGAAARALEVLSPSISHAPEAKTSAVQTVKNAPTAAKAEELKQNLKTVLGEL